MFYDFQPNQGAKTKTSIEMPDCTITGNTVQYSLKDGSILQYELDNEGNIVSSSAKQQDTVQLTKYQLSVFEALKGRDGNDSDLKKSDLKDLTEEQLLELINTNLEGKSSFSAFETSIDKNAITIKFKNKDGKETKLQIEFKPKFLNGVGNFFKNLFSSDKKTDITATIKVGNLEEQPIEVEQENHSEEIETPKETRKSKRAQRRAERRAAREANKVDNAENTQNEFTFKGNVIPASEYIVKSGDRIIKIANELGIPLSCIEAANQDKNLSKLGIGDVIIIPEQKTTEGLEIKTTADVAEATGFSESFVKTLQFNEGFEGKPYWDKVRYSVGYGHSGRILGKYIKGENRTSNLIEMNSKNIDKIHLSRTEANEILAQDLVTRTAEAETLFGESFKKAPRSLQAGIVDIIFNAGSEKGFSDDYTQNIKTNLENGDYITAVKNLLLYPKNPESYKRNCYRILIALEDFSIQDRKAVLEDPNIKEYFDKVKKHLTAKKLPHEAIIMDKKYSELLAL